jgi:hypothetical protein
MSRAPFPRISHVAASLALLAALAPVAVALPSVGASRPPLRVVDAWDRVVDLSRLGTMPVLVVYEDSDSSTQNQAFKDDLAALAKGDGYAKSVALIAVADVQGYDYWPVRGFVKQAIRSESQKFSTPIYCDWDGGVRRTLGLRRGVSNVVLYGRDGAVRFSFEGAMPPSKRGEVIDLLRREVTR